MMKRYYRCCALGLTAMVLSACQAPRARPIELPNVGPAVQPGDGQVLKLDPSQITPMYRELVSIDLPSVVRVALAQNFDIHLARYEVEAMRGEYESILGSAFPVIAPFAMFDYVDGTVRATEGDLVNVGFRTFQPAIAVEWVVNPGQVIYNIIAAKKRLRAVEHQEEAVLMATLRDAVGQYYDLILAQATIASDRQAVTESEELLRITKVRSRTGTGVVADELRAEARLAERKQDLAIALNRFYLASIALNVTLHLDSIVTLVPKVERLFPTQLVRDDYDIEDLVALAIQFRPDLQSVRELLEEATAKKGSIWWGAFGPQFQASYQYGGITGHANGVDQGQGIPSNLIVNPASATGSFSGNPLTNGLIKEGILRSSNRLARDRDKTFSFRGQHRGRGGVSWRFGLSAFGDLKSAGARYEQAVIAAERLVDQVQAQVAGTVHTSKTNHELIELASQQVASAEEAMRLTQANLRAGAMTTLDVLQSQDAVSQARLRYAEAVVRYNQSQVELLAALGVLQPEALWPAQADQGETAEEDQG